MINVDEMDKIEKPRKDYFRRKGIKTCRASQHLFTIKTDECNHNHCSRCGMCQAVNGCFQILKSQNRKNEN